MSLTNHGFWQRGECRLSGLRPQHLERSSKVRNGPIGAKYRCISDLSVTNPWQHFDGNMRALMDIAEAERTGSVPFVERQVVRNEYAMIRNGGLRELTFSEWNGGIRAMTDAYWRGDDPTEFRLGGSYWTINTEVGAAEDCDAGEIYHTYYSYNGTGVNRDSGNGCTAEIADIFVRPRMLPDLVQTDE